MAQSQLTATSTSRVQVISPASASRVAGISGMSHHAQLLLFVERGLSMFPKLVSNSWAQVILPHQHPQGSSIFNTLENTFLLIQT